jgi:hypothetical protein
MAVECLPPLPRTPCPTFSRIAARSSVLPPMPLNARSSVWRLSSSAKLSGRPLPPQSRPAPGSDSCCSRPSLSHTMGARWHRSSAAVRLGAVAAGRAWGGGRREKWALGASWHAASVGGGTHSTRSSRAPVAPPAAAPSPPSAAPPPPPPIDCPISPPGRRTRWPTRTGCRWGSTVSRGLASPQPRPPPAPWSAAASSPAAAAARRGWERTGGGTRVSAAARAPLRARLRVGARGRRDWKCLPRGLRACSLNDTVLASFEGLTILIV